MFRPTIGGGIIFFPPSSFPPVCLSANSHHYQRELPSFLKDESIKGIQKKKKKKKFKIGTAEETATCTHWHRERPKTPLLYPRDTRSRKAGANARTGIRLCQGSNGRSRFSVSGLLPPVMDREVNNRSELGSSARSVLWSSFPDKGVL